MERGWAAGWLLYPRQPMMVDEVAVLEKRMSDLPESVPGRRNCKPAMFKQQQRRSQHGWSTASESKSTEEHRGGRRASPTQACWPWKAMATVISQTLNKGWRAEKWHVVTQILKRPLKSLNIKGLEMKRNNGEM